MYCILIILIILSYVLTLNHHLNHNLHHPSISFIYIIHLYHLSASSIYIIYLHNLSTSYICIIYLHHLSTSSIQINRFGLYINYISINRIGQHKFKKKAEYLNYGGSQPFSISIISIFSYLSVHKLFHCTLKIQTQLRHAVCTILDSCYTSFSCYFCNSFSYCLCNRLVQCAWNNIFST